MYQSLLQEYSALILTYWVIHYLQLSFTPEETKDLANVQNTDGLAKLLRKSNRDFSIKVHNPDDHHPEAAPEAKTPSVDEKGANEGHHYPMDQPVSTPDTEKLGTRKYNSR
jgi:hypothetical protein